MKQSIKHLLEGALLLALPLFLTSCDDILGEWSKPTPTIITPETPVKVTSITLNKTSTSLPIGATETLTVETVAPDNATDKSVTWSSDNTAAATVDDNGLVTAVAIGTAIITATAKDGSGVTATCTVVVGLLTGKFTINAGGDQIQFAQGNLQAVCTSADGDASTQETWTWGFAANQWDYCGKNATFIALDGNGSVSTAGTVDLFKWVGESSTTLTTGAAQYGITNSGTASHFGTNPNTDNLKTDWGNTIGTGWRTLTKDEWVYLLDTRGSGSTVNGTDNARFTHATINTDGTGVKGIILFPDGVTIANGEATSWGNINAASAWASCTKCTTAQWVDLANKGCVFLPAAGDYGGNAGDLGNYWSYNSSSWNYAYHLNFNDNSYDPTSTDDRLYSYSVRLVYPAQ